ncbi:MAG: class I SAM-dependent methyltransferase [Caldilineaceae bacterium]
MNPEVYEPMLNAQRSGYGYPGFADCYDLYRPKPPLMLPDLLCQLAQAARPQLVVDLGSGTGRSTFLWSHRAHQVLGIEPLAAMRQIAEAANTAPHVHFQGGVAQQTTLPDGAAEIVTCAQALHWMEPESTFAEVARILRSGGVFAAYDYDRTPSVHWEVEQAFERCMARRQAWWQRAGEQEARCGSQQWPKDEHLARLQQSGHFRYVKEIVLHRSELWSAERWVGYALSCLPGLAESGLSAAEIGLNELRDVARRTVGAQGLAVYFSYHVRVAVK